MHAGIDVDYQGTVAGITPGRAKLRCIILCWTGDYPAQCEVGKFIKNGKRLCRRDTLEGISHMQNNNGPKPLLFCLPNKLQLQVHF